MRSELIKEEWRPIPGYFGLYDASNFGRIRSLKFGKVKILKPFGKKDYLRIELNKDGKRKRYSVHRLVYEAFNGEIPEGMQVNHINEIKTDNSLWNLNLMTPKENSNYGTGIQRGVDKRRRNKIELVKYKGLKWRKKEKI